MGKSGSRTESNVILVPDDAHIVRYTELADLFEELGTAGMVARYLEISVSTVTRHLAAAGIPLRKEFVGRMGKEIDRLQHELADDAGVIEAQRIAIEDLQRQLRKRADAN